MTRSKVGIGIVVLLVLAVGIVSACGGPAPSQPPAEDPVEADGEALLQDRCTECHSLDRVTGAQKTQAEWEQTVSQMVSRGAELSDEEQVVLVDYLAETYGS